MKKRKLAIFDIDGTIFRSSLVIQLTNALVARGIFPKNAEEEIENDYKAWLNREAGYENYIWKVVEVYRKYIVGCREKDISKTVDAVLSDEKKKLYRYTRDLIRKLKKEKYFLFAISGSPGHILTRFAADFGFDKYFGGYYEVVDGKFTGKEPFGNPANNKKKTIEDFIATSKYHYDLRNATAVGDTQSDIPMLKMVGKPIAFNPNMALAKYARKRGWRIVVERKDVIYDIKRFNILKTQ